MSIRQSLKTPLPIASASDLTSTSLLLAHLAGRTVDSWECQKDDALSLVAAQTKRQLTGSDFWAFVDRIRQGRRLVITADHGYANSHTFSDEVQNPETIQLLRNTFGAMRNSVDSPNAPWPRNHLPPLVAMLSGHLAVIGQRKWSVQSGFPHLCHGGLSLLEATVPYIELPEL